MKMQRGFTLIESIIVIVLMAFAMVTISSFLVPQITRSANPHYQARAAALGQSVMSTILAQGFDQQSDFTGGDIRCGEGVPSAASCTTILGNEESDIALYNDVDDYLGCWEPKGSNGCKDLNYLVGDGSDTRYKNFRLDIQVSYQEVDKVKHITLTISAPNQTPVELHAYKGNY